MIPFIGVRISWLMLARKSDLSRNASVAWSRASAMGASAAASSAVISASVPTQPAGPPAASSTGLEVSSAMRGDPPGPDLAVVRRTLADDDDRPNSAAIAACCSALIHDAPGPPPPSAAQEMPVISAQRALV